tara:strand:+ start:457 stop:789 length:333 start_codon:yes stop_codon:yes gene_type:complete
MSSSTKQYLCDCGVTTNYKKYKKCLTTKNKATVQSASDYIKKKLYNSVNCTECHTKQDDLMIFYGNRPKVLVNIYTNVNATLGNLEEPREPTPPTTPVVAEPGIFPGSYV